MADTRRVNDELTAIPPARRRWLALALAPVGVALLVAAVLTMSLAGAGWKVAGVLVAALALALLGVAWGLWRSVALSQAAAGEQRLDEVLAAAARSQGAACGGDSTGAACGSAGSRGCGAGCLTRTTPEAERSNAPQRS